MVGRRALVRSRSGFIGMMINTPGDKVNDKTCQQGGKIVRLATMRIGRTTVGRGRRGCGGAWLIVAWVLAVAGAHAGKEAVVQDLRGKRVLMVVAARDFRDEELFEPSILLRGRGATVTVASEAAGPAESVFGKTVPADRRLADCRAEDYDAVVFVGGPGAKALFDDAAAHALARAAAAAGKIVAAICIAPITLANAGVLTNRACTCFPGVSRQLAGRGARLENKPVVRDGRILTADGPTSATPFAEALAGMLAEP